MRPLRCISPVVAGLVAALCFVPSASAKAYDTHVFRVTKVKLDGGLKFDAVPSGAGLTEHMTRTVKLAGKPGGTFRLGSHGRNVAFFREAVSSGGNISAGPVPTVFTQAGSYTFTRERTVYDDNDQPHKVVETESSGNCDDRKTGRFSLHATFRVRAGKLVGLFDLPQYPELKDCQGQLDPLADFATTPSGFTRSRPASARTLVFPIRYSKTTQHTEDGVAVTQVVTWTGSVTLVKVKDCPFRRGVNQSACTGQNPDAL
jgi:hypothetical protein